MASGCCVPSRKGVKFLLLGCMQGDAFHGEGAATHGLSFPSLWESMGAFVGYRDGQMWFERGGAEGYAKPIEPQPGMSATIGMDYPNTAYIGVLFLRAECVPAYLVRSRAKRDAVEAAYTLGGYQAVLKMLGLA